MAHPQHLEVGSHGGVTVATLIDRRVIEDSQILKLGQELSDLITASGGGRLVVNFSAVQFLSSAALGKLIVVHKLAKQHGRRLILTNIQPDIHVLFTTTRLDELFEIQPNEADAIEVP